MRSRLCRAGYGIPAASSERPLRRCRDRETGEISSLGTRSLHHGRTRSASVLVLSIVFIVSIGSVDQFGQSKAFTLKKPTRVCLAADKNSEGFKDETARLVCYQALVVKGQPKHVKVTGLFLNNQFGPDEVDTLKETEFCVPSSENSPA
jgi:hypothetical protein